MNQHISKIISWIMIVIAILFIAFALMNPQAGFPWSQETTYVIYMVYILLIIFFMMAPFQKK